jgi:hypothetical protein
MSFMLIAFPSVSYPFSVSCHSCPLLFYPSHIRFPFPTCVLQPMVMDSDQGMNKPKPNAPRAEKEVRKENVSHHTHTQAREAIRQMCSIITVIYVYQSYMNCHSCACRRRGLQKNTNHESTFLSSPYPPFSVLNIVLTKSNQCKNWLGLLMDLLTCIVVIREFSLLLDVLISEVNGLLPVYVYAWLQ